MKTLLNFSVFVILVSVSILLPIFGYTQDTVVTDTTGGGTPGDSGLFDKIIANLEIILPVVIMVYELIVRYVPTAKNWSILTKLFEILNALIPNKAKQGEAKGATHEMNRAVEKAEEKGIAKKV